MESLNLYYLISEAVNFFQSQGGEEAYFFTQELLQKLRSQSQQINNQDILNLKNFFAQVNYYNLDSLWNGTLSSYIQNLQNLDYIDALLPILLSWQRKRFQDKTFIGVYRNNFINFINVWKPIIKNVEQQLTNTLFLEDIDKLNIFIDVFDNFKKQIYSRTHFNEPVMIAKILHFLKPHIFIPYDNPIMNLLGLSTDEIGFSTLNIWLYNFYIRNIIFVRHLENSFSFSYNGQNYNYSFQRLLDMVLWCGANGKIKNPIWQRKFYSFIEYMLSVS